MIVPCVNGPLDGFEKEIPDETKRNSTLQFARNVAHKQPNASAYSEYKLSNDRKRLNFLGYSKIKFKDLK
jgi:hypothetical protein